MGISKNHYTLYNRIKSTTILLGGIIMIKNGKRLISFLLICVLCFSLVPFAAAMSSDVQHGEYIFYDDFSGDLSKWQIVKDDDDTDTQMSITSAGTLNLGATNQQTCVPLDEEGQPLKVSGDWILTFDAISPANSNWTGI